MFKLNWGKLVFSVLFILVISVVFISQSNRAEAQSWFSGASATGYRATIGIGQVTIWDSTCQKITNANASLNYFIPTKSSLEWTAFSAVASLFSLSISSCTPTSCSPGYYVSTVCTICPAGSYCTGEVSISGTCAAGYYCPAGSSSATQNACAAGTANPSTGQSAVGACASCAAGTYNSGTGNTGCSACGCGYYCTGGTARAACGANYYYAGANGTGSGNCVYCGDNYSSPAGSCAAGNCTIRTCAGSTTNGYSYSAINYTASVGVSKGVTNGTCSATASCSAGTVSVTGESASCNSGWFNNNGLCSDGCESKCGDGVCNNGETTGTCPGDCGCSPGATRTMYAALTNPSCGTYSASEVQTCQANYIFNGSYTLASPPTASTRTMYANATSGCGTYGSLSEGQTCTSGGWSGSYSLSSPPSAATRTMYLALTSSCGVYNYNSEGQTCQSNGIWTGSYSSASPPSAVTRTGYTTSSVDCSSSCTTQTQTCTSGGWDGTGIGSCSAVTCSGGTPYCASGTCSVCSPGQTRTRYQSGTVTCGTYCSSEGQTCQSNGTWNGSYISTSDCSASVNTRTVYSVQNVPCGSDCNGGNYYRTASCQSDGSYATIGGYLYTSCSMSTNTCSAGQYCSGSCLSCGNGYSSAGATSCTSCPNHSSAYGGGTSISSCSCSIANLNDPAECYNLGYGYHSCFVQYGDCNNNMSDGCEVLGACPPRCGDGICNGTETCNTCSSDCVCYEYCGNGFCGGGETYASCQTDCPYDCPSAFKPSMCSGYDNCMWNSVTNKCVEKAMLQ